MQDANILIDLELAGLFDLWLQLGIETHTTDFITNELTQGGHKTALSYIHAGRIQSHALSSEELADVVALQMDVSSGPDLNDCSVLYLAKKLGAMLLTGDNALRMETAKIIIEVHGTLWIFDRLVERGLLSPQIAASKLGLLLSANRFLPEKECRYRLRRWNETS